MNLGSQIVVRSMICIPTCESVQLQIEPRRCRWVNQLVHAYAYSHALTIIIVFSTVSRVLYKYSQVVVVVTVVLQIK
jgi:hypothetical protein